ncbi:hypothetical protein ACIRS3_07625 [Streptomyces virginiae]|uniref:hypothetical protein n=1 Tax=Streptomyces virginiae TaxID=1961 RepID=UPI003826EDD5
MTTLEDTPAVFDLPKPVGLFECTAAEQAQRETPRAEGERHGCGMRLPLIVIVLDVIGKGREGPKDESPSSTSSHSTR